MLDATPRPRPSKLGMLGAMVVGSVLFLASCSTDGTEATNVNITPATQAASDPASEAPVESPGSQGPDIQYYYADDVETEGTFVLDEDGVETTLTMKAVGGIVTEQTTTNVFDYAAFGLSSAEEAIDALDEVIITVEGVDGFEQDLEYGLTQATQVTHIDFEVLDLSEAESMPGAITSGVDENSVVSYESNWQMLLDVGFVEVNETTTS